MRTAHSLVESHTAKLFGPTYRRDLSQHVSCTDVVWDFDCLTHKVRQHNSYTLAKPYDMQHRPVAETFLCKAWKMNSWSPKITEATRSAKKNRDMPRYRQANSLRCRNAATEQFAWHILTHVVTQASNNLPGLVPETAPARDRDRYASPAGTRPEGFRKRDFGVEKSSSSRCSSIPSLFLLSNAY